MTKALPRYERRSSSEQPPTRGYIPSKDSGFYLYDLWNECAKFAHTSSDVIDRMVTFWNAQCAKTDEEILAEHRYDGFAIFKRNTHHWDISATRPNFPDEPNSTTMGHGQDQRERAFRIRGEPGAVLLLDERTMSNDISRGRDRRLPTMTFPDLTAAMAFVSGLLLREVG